MHAHACCRYTLKCTKEEYEAMKAVISKPYAASFEEPKENVIEVENPSYGLWFEGVEEFAVEIAKSAPDASFIMEGIFELTDAYGDYINYCFKYEDGKLECRDSDQYYVAKINTFEDYDEYLEAFENSCEDYGDEDDPVKPLTREQFEECASEEDGEFYVLNEGCGDHVLVVPLDESWTIELDV